MRNVVAIFLMCLALLAIRDPQSVGRYVAQVRAAYLAEVAR